MENKFGFIISTLVVVAITNFSDIDKTTNLRQFWTPSFLLNLWFCFECIKMLRTKLKKSMYCPQRQKKRTPGNGNPWVYKDKLELLPESRKLTKTEVLQIKCRDRYKIRTSIHVTDDQTANNELYHMFGEMLGQDIPFMRQWVRCFVLMHKKFVGKLAGYYLKGQNIKLTQWLQDVKAGSKADVFALFILCIATDTHCFMYTKVEYWTTLLDDPQKHTEYV